MDEMATRIALEMDKNSTSWVLSTAAALYWRVKGHASQAVQCLRHSLYYAPRDMKDIPLVSLANILHRAGLYNDALIGMISHKKSLITIFGHKHKIKNFIKKFDIFH